MELRTGSDILCSYHRAACLIVFAVAAAYHRRIAAASWIRRGFFSTFKSILREDDRDEKPVNHAGLAFNRRII